MDSLQKGQSNTEMLSFDDIILGPDFLFYLYVGFVVVVVVFLFPANNTTMERYSIIQNKLLEATREAIRLIGLVALGLMYDMSNLGLWEGDMISEGVVS